MCRLFYDTGTLVECSEISNEYAQCPIGDSECIVLEINLSLSNIISELSADIRVIIIKCCCVIIISHRSGRRDVISRICIRAYKLSINRIRPNQMFHIFCYLHLLSASVREKLTYDVRDISVVLGISGQFSYIWDDSFLFVEEASTEMNVLLE